MIKGIMVNEEKIDKLLAEAKLSLTDAERICGLPKNWRQNIKRNGTASEDTVTKLGMLLRVNPEELLQKDEPKKRRK